RLAAVPGQSAAGPRAGGYRQHGESMVRLMRPGLHSGTLPKLYAKMRHAESRLPGGTSRKLRRLRRHAHHIEQAVRRFAERELVRLISLDHGWGNRPLAVGEVRLGSNRIAVELTSAAGNDDPLWLTFEEQSGWLLASIARAGWLAALSEGQRHVLAAALAGFYKAAGVDLVREQLEAALPPGVPYDIAANSLVVWPAANGAAEGGGYEAEVVYDLTDRPCLVPHTTVGRPVDMPTLDASAILFRNAPISWLRWLTTWRADHAARPAADPPLPSVLPAVP
ncbi:MAG: hypothetical protein PHU85_20590, partial [Phycisphaerae bacterium]|nr:hypothetical protein [Phycisphaerae bacterium]